MATQTVKIRCPWHGTEETVQVTRPDEGVKQPLWLIKKDCASAKDPGPIYLQETSNGWKVLKGQRI